MTETAQARRQQPPFAASAMDGYALKSVEADLHAQFKVVGEAAAGHAWQGDVQAGQAVRIFTGAPLPSGTDRIVIQEDVSRTGDLITITSDPGAANHVRPAGGDFCIGDTLAAPTRLGPSDVALLAAMNVPVVTVSRRLIVALISTGDELVMPGETPGPDQILVSNTFGLAAMLENAGAECRVLPIARDTEASLSQAFALTRGADQIVTIGGASVGDHDLVAKVAESQGLERSFYKIAMRPGKPLMAGRMNGIPMIGLPGNPVSAMVCGRIFLVPVIEKMLGLGERSVQMQTAVLTEDITANGPRAHYMRAHVAAEGIRAFDRQDSSLLSVLNAANALLLRPPHDGPRKTGETVSYLAF
jgi:molybdopterin molybdotransferase